MSRIENIAQLEAIYGVPGETSTVKVTRCLTPEYRAYAKAARFLALATCGPEGLDCSPRGDRENVFEIVDDSTLHMPDRRGNNRVDSLKNIVRDPRVALLLLFPGSHTTLRINGLAHISIDAGLLAEFAVDGQAPRSVIVIQIQEVYFQCGRAMVRSELWDADRFVDAKALPSAGEILARLSENRVGGKTYDDEWPSRARQTLW